MAKQDLQWHESIYGDNFSVHVKPLDGYYFGLCWNSVRKVLTILKLTEQELNSFSKFKKNKFSGYFKNERGEDIKC
jgi:hypothetical protein